MAPTPFTKNSIVSGKVFAMRQAVEICLSLACPIAINGSRKEIKFPLTLTLSPIGGEGIKLEPLSCSR
jgi:hypothetical protein